MTTKAVAVQMTAIFDSFLGQLRTDLQELKISGEPPLSSLQTTVNVEPSTSKGIDETEKETPPVSSDEVKIKFAASAPTCTNESTQDPISADKWIDDIVNESHSHPIHITNCHPALLQQLSPAVKIEIVDGDPRKWDQFIGSFKALVHDVVPMDAQRIAILRQLLSPRLRASIAPSFHGPRLYRQALIDLRRLFGDPNLIIDAYIRSLFDILPMKYGNSDEVSRFFYEVHGAVNTLRAYGAKSELSARAMLQAVVSNLNKRLQSSWAKRIFDLRPRTATLCDLDEWLEELVMIQNNFQVNVCDSGEHQERKFKPKETRRHLNILTTSNTLMKCVLCENRHRLEDCSDFLSSTPQQRAEMLKQRDVKKGEDSMRYEPVRSHIFQKMEVTVLLDPGSEATLIREDVAHKVGLDAPKQDVRLGTFHGSDPILRCGRVNFKLHSLDERRTFEVNDALTVPALNVAHRRIDFARLRKNWPHLCDIDPDALRYDDVMVLVGMDIVEAHEQHRILKPPKGVRAPHAVLTPFGWSIISRLPALHQNLLPSSTKIHNLTVSIADEDLTTLVKDQRSVESLGIRKTDQEILSPDEERAMEILRTTTRRVNGRYECGMLWKGVQTEIQDSFPTAKARLAGLERRFRLDSDFASRYSDVITDYLQDGHAKLCPLDDHHRDRWFMPHHAVRNPNKPKGLRVVFDASARTNGVSLNDMLLTGPYMLTNLFGLLVRFREHPVAVSADIAKMFQQVRVREEDQSMLRFLWRQPGNNEPVIHLQMTVHIFGAVCSPSVCTYVLRKTAEDYRAQFPRTWQKVTENFYSRTSIIRTN
uniref:Peptidase A2 domain-containing protein n=1 Tax=Trichuris muris TaxID=70415 RepID=A0A5S6QAN9_TRIMR